MAQFVCIVLAALLGLALGTVNEMQLVGRFQSSPCTGDDPSCPRPESRGVNQTIWHGDGSCSTLKLYCSLDRYYLTLESPAHVYTHSFCALGQPDTPSLPRDKSCCRIYSGGLLGQRAFQPSSTKYEYYFHPTDGNTCGTHVEEKPSSFGLTSQQYTNKVEIIEFLEQEAGGLRPSVSLVSHTHVYIKCCEGSPPITCRPPPPAPSVEVLQRCTEKQFQFTCTHSVDRESFHCFVELKAGESLQTEDVGFALDKCVAHPVGVSGDPVEIFSNGAGNAALQTGGGVCNTPDDKVDNRLYSVEGPWIQWESADYDLHRVEIDCTVKVVPKASLPPVTNIPDMCRSPPGYVSSHVAQPPHVPFIRAGKLKVIQ